ncbi:MAG: hypothetical protein H6707_13055 [Deltaproteobacteria bacterium]|nr:hypothetical protein [Deltaproteobacteria bacterium]
MVYTSTQDPRHGTPHATNGDIYTIPYNDRAGGQARPLPGASDPQRNEYYPSFSPDDKWVAFNAANDDKSYSNPNAEVYIIPSSGGTPTRLKANDGPSCAPFSSPGIANSFPKWAPFASTIGNYSYYFLTFSSTRFGSNSQIFVAPIVVHQDEVSTTVTTYPALHLWNQGSEANHTPIWEKLRIPIVK